MSYLDEYTNNYSKKIFKPNRLTVYGSTRKTQSVIGNDEILKGSINIIPQFFFNKKDKIEFNNYSEHITNIIIPDMEESKNRYSPMQTNLISNTDKEIKFLNKKIQNIWDNENVWLTLGEYFITFNLTEMKCIITIEKANMKYTIRGYGKIIIYFILEFFKKHYPSKEYIIKLHPASSFAKYVWEKNGFKKTDYNNDYYNLDMEKAKEIHQKTLKDLNINKLLYYNLVRNN